MTTTMHRAIGSVFVAFALLTADAHASAGQQQGNDQATSLIEVRAARTTPAGGFTKMRLLGDGREAFVHHRRIVSDDDILAAEATPVDGGLVLFLQLSPDGATRLHTLGNSPREQSIAILVHGQLAESLPIQGPIEYDERMNIRLHLPPALVTEVVAEVRAKWQPLPSGDL